MTNSVEHPRLPNDSHSPRLAICNPRSGHGVRGLTCELRKASARTCTAVLDLCAHCGLCSQNFAVNRLTPSAVPLSCHRVLAAVGTPSTLSRLNFSRILEPVVALFWENYPTWPRASSVLQGLQNSCLAVRLEQNYGSSNQSRKPPQPPTEE